MADYRTDEEQVELLKDWWKKNGTSTVVMIALVVMVYFGGQYYRQDQNTRAEQATDQYDLMLAELDQNKRKEATDRARSILENYKNTVQAAHAAFMLAKLAVEEGQLDTAVKLLALVKDEAPLSAMQNIARLRLARVLSQQGKHDRALNLLAEAESGKLLGLFEEVKGDIYLAKGNRTKAKEAYARSLQIEPTSIRQPVLRMKLEDLSTQDDKVNAS